MKRMSPEARVGLLVLAGLLLLVWMSLQVGKLSLGSGGGYLLTLQLDEAGGLAKESEVLMAGIPIGVVEGIRLQDGRAVLSLRIQSDLQLPTDSTGNLRTQGVLGEKYVSVQPGGSPTFLQDGDRLRSGAPPGDLDRLVASLNRISADVKRVTERLANVFGTAEGERNLHEIVTGLRNTAVGLQDVVAENRDDLRAAVANLRQLSGDLGGLVQENRTALTETLENARAFSAVLAERTPQIASGIDGLTGDLRALVQENRENLRVSLANLRVASARLSETMEAVDDLVVAMGREDGTLGKLIRDDSLYVELRDAGASLNRVLGRLDKGEGTLGKLLTDDTAYAELSAGLQNLNSITQKIERGEGTLGKLVNEESVHSNLNQTLEGVSDLVTGANRFQFELSYTGEFLADLGETKSYFGLEIRPRQDRFYYLALVDDPRGDQETETTERVVSDATGTHVEVEEKTVTLDRLKFSAQVGKRFSFLTLRGGLFESAGGVGADLDLWDEQLRLTFEAFDFAREDAPAHLKVAARWTMWRYLYVTAGLDDFIDDGGRADYFVGGGIRFLDEDLKFLLSPAASLAR